MPAGISRVRTGASWVWVLACFASAVVLDHAHAAPVSAGAERALGEARGLRLADHVAWRRLVHYRATWLGTFKSEVDGPEFFLSPNGKHDPERELAATLRAFFAPVQPGREDSHAVCRFPARFEWLDARLRLQSAVSRPQCSRLGRFYSALAAARVSIVYAANSLEYPASAFGHTFLRLTPRDNPAAGTGVDYQASTDTSNPVLYGVKGLTGLFDGRFGFHPISEKLHEYASEQDRELWEYELALAPTEVRRLALHLWELATTRSDYFYLTENCSYQVLAALEAAAPRLELVSQLKFVVLPADTVRALFQARGLVRRVQYHPSEHVRSGGAPRPLLPPSEKRPERGHGTMRFRLAMGASTLRPEGFTSLGYRLALHDLLDPVDGHPDLAQVQFLDTRLRYSPRRQRLTLDKLTFAELIALHPLSRWERRLSWRARAHGQRLRDDGCESRECFAHGLNASLGATLGTAGPGVAVFAMADAYALFSAELDGLGGGPVRMGVGPHAGVRLQFSRSTIALLTGTWSYLPAQDPGSTFEARWGFRSALLPQFALGVEAELQPAAIEAELAAYAYF
jgi:hypothetical protein